MMMKTTTPWDNDANHLLAMIAEKRGIMGWYRENDRRWYHAQVLVDLFDTTELHLRWGGPMRAKGTGMVIHLSRIDQQGLRSMALKICRRRIQHGYTLGQQPWTGH